MDVSATGGCSRASSWSSVTVVGGGVGGPFTMCRLSQVRRLFAPIGEQSPPT